ncbi:ComF family protein [Limibacterium fermenti]|uniref:ComF family protein n=1 Tax=Limibacterium fermenti TaxID=3229863 RepID=UPI000E826B42|nr:ComF family protein [Porphyromonadaceae bacterium]
MIIRTIHGLFEDLLQLFFPGTCLICGEKLVSGEEGVCLDCLYRLPRTHNFDIPGNEAEVLMSGRFPFVRIATFCLYSKGGMLPPLIHELKYEGRKEIGLLLGRICGRELYGSRFFAPLEGIVPVPLHPKKQTKRGFNQAEIIADGLSEVLSIPVLTGNLVRVEYNSTQTKRSKIQRWKNVEDIFRVNNPEQFAGKHLLLVDDVLTTGATIEACAHALAVCVDLKISVLAIGQAV